MARGNGRVWESLITGYQLFLVGIYAPDIIEAASFALDGRCTHCGYKVGHKGMHHAPWKHGKACHID